MFIGDPIRFAEKTSRNTVLVDLSWEKNTVPAEKNKLKSMDYKTSKQGWWYVPGYLSKLNEEVCEFSP